MRIHPRARIFTLLASSALALTLAPTTAQAGTYTVTGLCGIWGPYSNNGARVAVYDQGCGGLVARNTYGNFNSSQGAEGGWSVLAPAGTTIAGFSVDAFFKGTSGWDAALFDNAGRTYVACPGGNSCFNQNTAYLRPFNSGQINAGQLFLRVRCYATRCANTSSGDPFAPERGLVSISGSAVTIADGSAPSARITGGTAASSGWKGETETLTIDGADNVGIRQFEAYVDGRRVGTADQSGCSYAGRLVPCPSGSGTVALNLGDFSDGRHALSGRAIDSANNVGGSAERTIVVDNHAPVSPQEPVVEGGAGWRASRTRTVRWTNPPEDFAPISRARYELCPAAVESTDKKSAANARKRCQTKTVTGSNIAAVNIQLPSEDDWQLQRLWLEDAAGNHNRNAGVKVRGLAWDSTPPTEVAFADEDPADPARLNVRAADPVSGITEGAIEIRRTRSKLWRPLTTKVTTTGLTAMIDDENLRRGIYDLRAVAINGAGLQQGTDRRLGGLPARIKLPVRASSRLIAGRPAGRRCQRADGRRRCQPQFNGAPRVRVGRSSLLRGQLKIRGKSVKRRVQLQVFSRRLGTKQWKRLEPIRTTTRGRFRYRARRGPARTIRFRYPGTRKVRGDNAPVKLQVAASSTIRGPRRAVVNGEYATFRGQLRGGWVPTAGALVELQVYARGSWRTFAQPRTDQAGRWSYQYRFETISGNARFRFRARVRRQTGYPFATGASRTVHVRVRGL